MRFHHYALEIQPEWKDFRRQTQTARAKYKKKNSIFISKKSASKMQLEPKEGIQKNFRLVNNERESGVDFATSSLFTVMEDDTASFMFI